MYQHYVCTTFGAAEGFSALDRIEIRPWGVDDDDEGVAAVGSNVEPEAGRLHSHSKRFSGLYTGPYFDPTVPTNITTQLGTHAYLPCKVKQLGNKSVSWIRRRDAHILTVDRYTFIADERFQAFHVEATDTWTLQVKYVQARDAGQYECQVSTEPKMSHFVTLNVVVPKIEIMGESDIYVKTGSTVNLKCVITQSLEEPAYIFWYHDGERVLNYDRDAKDIRVERVSADTTIGTLIIYSGRREDSGNYTCAPSNLDSASVLLHVLNGEHPAAMQRGKNHAAAALLSPCRPIVLLALGGVATALIALLFLPRTASETELAPPLVLLTAPPPSTLLLALLVALASSSADAMLVLPLFVAWAGT
ncbi:hemicentin-1-like [Ischnura elegans]|uniref:hemicentin-1-like n=1 Tax=Ischnura elegans TaxID=197161 RepID=UPI001ED8BF20|nr:hemicentin-1-like [Ischnura elegans]